MMVGDRKRLSYRTVILYLHEFEETGGTFVPSMKGMWEREWIMDDEEVKIRVKSFLLHHTNTKGRAAMTVKGFQVGGNL